jgi:abhydrolase domain-containing protein 12
LSCDTKKKVSYPSHLDLTRPETLGLYATRHFHIKYEDDDKNEVSIAAWHVIPNHIVRRFHKHLQVDKKTLRDITNDEHSNANNNTVDERAEYSYKVIEAIIGSNFDIHDANKKDFLYEEILRKTKDPIVVYFHGNTGTRANAHRIELYQIVRKLGYHVIAIDYRGFADSSDISPTEKGCVEDALATYKYVKNLTNSPIYIYGHSLGKQSSGAVYGCFVFYFLFFIFFKFNS